MGRKKCSRRTVDACAVNKAKGAKSSLTYIKIYTYMYIPHLSSALSICEYLSLHLLLASLNYLVVYWLMSNLLSNQLLCIFQFICNVRNCVTYCFSTRID